MDAWQGVFCPVRKGRLLGKTFLYRKENRQDCSCLFPERPVWGRPTPMLPLPYINKATTPCLYRCYYFSAQIILNIVAIESKSIIMPEIEPSK